MRVKNLVGQKFGRLTVIELDKSNKHNGVYWICKCDCGNTSIVRSDALTSGNTKYCGCLASEQRAINGKSNMKHGMKGTKIYSSWQAMKKRCYNKKYENYIRYGGRGIKVCDEWLNDFQSFYNWAIKNGYKEGLTIDRIDINGNYEPSNCRWCTAKEQSRNTSKNIFLTFNNKTQCLTDWANELNISREILYYRINKGWETERALTEPIHKEKSRYKHEN